MLQNTPSEPPEKEAERQTNYLILRTLQHRLSPQAFADILRQVSFQILTRLQTQNQMELPMHTTWSGATVQSSFEELGVAQAHLDPKVLQNLVQGLDSEKSRQTAKPEATQNLAT